VRSEQREICREEKYSRTGIRFRRREELKGDGMGGKESWKEDTTAEEERRTKRKTERERGRGEITLVKSDRIRLDYRAQVFFPPDFGVTLGPVESLSLGRLIRRSMGSRGYQSVYFIERKLLCTIDGLVLNHRCKVCID
jgi:hypothetical protein